MQPVIEQKGIVLIRWLTIVWSVGLLSAAPLRAEIPFLSYEVAAIYPHDTEAVTQGLVYRDGRLYESTGGYGRSTLREVALRTGHIIRQHRLPSDLYAEGLALFKNRLYQLTWESETGIVYGVDDFRPQRRFQYAGEGWGLTHNGNKFIRSDGSERLYLTDPQGFKETGFVTVMAGKEPLTELNELEYIDGFVWANVRSTRRIAKISMGTGQVTAWLNLKNLLQQADIYEEVGDLNGIAYIPEEKLMIVTGKRWPKLFLLRIKDTRATP
jgi:glutaminyl-peptide cyclotransferase